MRVVKKDQLQDALFSIFFLPSMCKLSTLTLISWTTDYYYYYHWIPTRLNARGQRVTSRAIALVLSRSSCGFAEGEVTNKCVKKIVYSQ